MTRCRYCGRVMTSAPSHMEHEQNECPKRPEAIVRDLKKQLSRERALRRNATKRVQDIIDVVMEGDDHYDGEWLQDQLQPLYEVVASKLGAIRLTKPRKR